MNPKKELLWSLWVVMISPGLVTDSISNYTDLLNDTELFIGGRMTGEFQTQSGT